MVASDELLSCLTRYGRSYIQDFVASSKDVSDVVTYLRVEFILDLARAMSFRTKDPVTFERGESIEEAPSQITNQSHESELQNLSDLRIHEKED